MPMLFNDSRLDLVITAAINDENVVFGICRHTGCANDMHPTENGRPAEYLLVLNGYLMGSSNLEDELLYEKYFCMTFNEECQLTHSDDSRLTLD
jgi:hypothetical protein